MGTATNAGVVTILFGSSSGYSGEDSTYWVQPFLGPNIEETSDRFGAALAAGDFNGDGLDDLAVGAPGQDVFGIEAAGAVYIIYNAARGAESSEWSSVVQGLGFLELAEETDNFGSVLAVGDFDGDSYNDLAVGVPSEDVTVDTTTFSDAGVVQVIYGSQDGLTIDGDELFYQGHEGLQDDTR